MPHAGFAATIEFSRRHRQAAVYSARLIMVATALIMPFYREMLPALSWFMPAFGALIVLTDGLTAGLLIVQARLRGESRLRFLGAAYLFSALVVFPHLLAFPGVFAATPIIGGADTAVWLWCCWHGGFVACVLVFLFANDRLVHTVDRGRLVLFVVVCVLVLTVAATAGLPWLPTLLQGGNFQRLNTLGIGPVVLVLCCAAAWGTLYRLRLRDPLSAWLWVAMVAATADVLLTLLGGGRFTVGWYGARILSLTTGVAVLFSLLCHLMREAERVAEVNEQLEQLLRTDALTDVANRRAFDDTLDAEWRRATRSGLPLSLLMIDVDHFKRFNDRYGHPAGDECLRQVASALRSTLKRGADMAARLGGEEFGILLPATDEEGAGHVARQVREWISSLHIPHETSEQGRVTVSIGVATAYPATAGQRAAILVERADQALYRAKSSGRNTVCIEAARGRALIDG